MPYVSLPYLDDPVDCPVWRYMNLEKLLSILIDHALFFASRTTLAQSDKYQGQATASELVGLEREAAQEIEEKYHRPTLNSFFFNCWHMNDTESDAMWKIYVNGVGGVAIRSNITGIKQCFHNSPTDVSLGRIHYIDNEPGHLDHPLRRCMRKKPAFKHEQEVRLVFYEENRERSGHSGLLIPVDVSVLIEKIVVSPRAESWFLSLVKNLATTLGYKIEVVSSEDQRHCQLSLYRSRTLASISYVTNSHAQPDERRIIAH
jgi:hypothetical protein